MHLSLGLIYHHQNNIMNVPHFITKDCILFLVEKIRSLLNFGMVFWQVFVGDRRKISEENKPLQ